MKTLKILALSGVAFGAMAVSADADVLVQTWNIPQTALNFNLSKSLQGFNVAWGTLTGITIKLDTSTTANISIFNPGAASPFSDATAAVPVSVNVSGGTVATSIATAGPVNGTAAAGGYTNINGLTATGSSGLITVAAGNWGAYESPFTLNFTAIGGPGSYTGTGTDLFFGGSAVSGGTYTITYDYEAAPELSTWAMMGLGFAGLGFAGFRARKRVDLAA